MPPAHCHTPRWLYVGPVGRQPDPSSAPAATSLAASLPNVAIVLDGNYLNPIGGGFAGGYQFFGVLTSNLLGFAEVQFRELDGNIEQLRLLFSDDFTILAEPPQHQVPALSLPARAALAALLLVASARALQRSRSAAR